MLAYTICEIGGKQYKFFPNQPIEVDFQGKSNGDIAANVLLISEDGKLKIGRPYLKEKLILKRLEDTKGAKIRVSKYHAKANYRKTRGSRLKLTKVVLTVKKAS